MRQEVTDISLTMIMKKWFILSIGMIASFFAPIKFMLVGSLILVVLDWHTGIRAARKRKEPILSKGLYRTAIKFKDYALLIIIAHMMTKVFFPDLGIDFASMASAYVAYVEFKSFCENMAEITGKEIWNKIFDAIPNIQLGKKS